MTAEQAWTPFVQRSIEDYQKLCPATRAEVLRLARGHFRSVVVPSPEAMSWWRGLPGLPRHNRAVFAAIRDFRSDR